MTITELNPKLESLKDRFASIREKKDVGKLKEVLEGLKRKISEPDFWNNSEEAQKVSQKAGDITNEIAELDEIGESLNNLIAYLEDVKEEDKDMLELIENDLNELDKTLDKVELSTFLSGKFDPSDCIFVIKAGQGGTEAMDWTDMLMRMYTRYFNSVGWKVEVLDTVPGTEAGYQTVTMKVSGRFAYGYLKHEHGTHRLVRNSPFNSAGARQTSFAGVTVTPVVDEDVDIEIPDEDIEFTAVRSSGAGGQSVNKTSSKARIVHKPTGIAVESSVHRKQHQNRDEAMKMLKAQLFLLEEEKQKAEIAEEKGEYKKASWGNQIRNYVFSPYKLVKDLRTNIETSQIDKIMDGDLQEFIDAEVRML